jgi:hypothetical protein
MVRDDPSVQTAGPTAGAECPYCGSTDTVRDHPKGPALCRSMQYCENCQQPFEKFE